ncbi:hypothetical protein R1sor_014387 [Riccia sorocarpa]|uniref:glycerophosphodiester phosphodiesterase n=1 Tax=Riccia sorocarpa TaxID=122646 RepID=A0ABD3H9I0_9MARC
MIGAAPPLLSSAIQTLSSPSSSASSVCMFLQSVQALHPNSICGSQLLVTYSRYSNRVSVGIRKLSQLWRYDSSLGCPSCRSVRYHQLVSFGGNLSEFIRVPGIRFDMAAPAVARPVGFNLGPLARDVPLVVPGLNSSGQDSYSHGRRSDPLVVIGHRGCGKNNPLSIGDTPGSRLSIRENTVKSFNLAASNGADYVEFDVQVTKDGHVVIFHDDLLLSETEAFRIQDLTLEEFLSFGPQKDQDKVGKNLVRRGQDGVVKEWTATLEDSLCTLKEAFEQTPPTLGFNIEMKFHDKEETSEAELRRSVAAVLADIAKYANGRNIFFSSFHPDAAIILRQEQSAFPVFFLTCGGEQIHADERRNSVEAAIRLCEDNGLQGLVTEVLPILKNPELAVRVKEAGLSLLTYGDHNNLAEALAQQYISGVDGIIVDCVREMVTAARTVHALSNFVQPDWTQWTQQQKPHTPLGQIA